KSVWPALKPFLPTEAEKQRANIDRDDAVVKGKPKVDLKTLDTVEKARKAYADGDIDRDTAKRLWDQHGWGAKGPQVPAGGARPAGMVEEGNIDLHARPIVKNPDGGYSTVNTMTFGIDGGKFINIPGVDDKRQLSKDEALEQYKKTGKHLGVFSSQKAAEDAANALHLDQEREYGDKAKQRKVGGAYREFDQKWVDHLNAEGVTGTRKPRSLAYAADYFAKNGADQGQRDLAARIAGKIREAGDEHFKFVPMAGNIVDGVAGVTQREGDKIVVGLHARDGVNGETFLHESLHGLVKHYAKNLEALGNPEFDGAEREKLMEGMSPDQVAATNKFVDVYHRVRDVAGDRRDAPVWLSEARNDADEFLSRAMTDVDFQDWLRQQPASSRGDKTLWDKVVDGVKSMVFGGEKVTEKQRTLLEDALEAGNGLVDAMH
ncbi:MAG: hypothetical protein EBY18_23525, partial [Alphaproteobacteria bacterium]|nr:hypothetical protein [Alphaproteobacteria bacterium]